MTQQHIDTIMIDGQNHWLGRPLAILPPGHAERIGLEIRPESTANYKGWDAHWKIENSRLWLAELSVVGFLGRHKLKTLEECSDDQEKIAILKASSIPRNIGLKEIFESAPPIFASWISQRIVAVSTADDTQYRRDDFDGVTGAQTLFLGIEHGLVVSDETVPNPQWDPERSEHRQRQAERKRAEAVAADLLQRRRK